MDLHSTEQKMQFAETSSLCISFQAQYLRIEVPGHY